MINGGAERPKQIVHNEGNDVYHESGSEHKF